jgi:competence protein ComEA
MIGVPPPPSGTLANLAMASPPQVTASPGVSYPLPPLAIPPAAPPPQPTLARSWPEPAQWALAVLLFLATALLVINACGHLQSGAEPGTLSYRVDLNRASRAELLQLPGVGPRLARRIEEFRSENEGFERVEDLLYVQGIGQATLERLRPHVIVGTWEEPTTKAADHRPAPGMQPVAAQPVKKSKKELALQGVVIDVNAAPQVELQRLPGIGPKMSLRIIDERAKGRFAKVDDLRRVHGIGPKTLDRLRPYVTVGKAVHIAER